MTRADIRRGMASAFFATAWADYQEESPTGVNLSGCEITEVMPTDWDPSAWAAADTLLAKLDALLGRPTEAFAAEHPGGLLAVNWGHYAAMEAMGHGVGLWEYGVTLPRVYHEYSSLDLDPRVYPDLQGS